MESLALTYRPRRFDDLVGQHAAQVLLRQMVIKNRIPRALIFDGSRGTGKTTTARILAAAINCVESHEVPGVRSARRDDGSPGIAPRLGSQPCGTCPSCKAVFDGSSIDVLEIDAASNGGVDDIRNLRQQLMYRQSSDYRTIILDEAHSISSAGFNALLKTLEEPPPNTVFILCTTEPHKIPDTVASRCIPFTFRRLAASDIHQRLADVARQEGFNVEDALLAQLADRADGAMRNGLMLLDQVTRVGLTTAEQYQRLIGRTDHAPGIISALTTGDIPAAFAATDDALTRVSDPATIVADLVTLLRDVLVLRTGGEISKTGKALADRQNIALTLDTPTTVAAMKVIWDLQTKIRISEPRSALELAVVMLADVFKAASATPVTRMTLAQMTN